MLNKEILVKKMEERGFTVYATIYGATTDNTTIQFISAHMYNPNYKQEVPKRKRLPIINVIVDLEAEEFRCVYNVPNSINTLNTPTCGSVMNDNHFNKIVSRFESNAICLMMLA